MSAPDHTRLGPEDRFWLVTDPNRNSVLADILCETSLAGLQRQFLGGLTMEERPTIFTDERGAVEEARARLRAAGIV